MDTLISCQFYSNFFIGEDFCVLHFVGPTKNFCLLAVMLDWSRHISSDVSPGIKLFGRYNMFVKLAHCHALYTVCRICINK